MKALKAGSAKITAKIGKKKYVCKVTVRKKKTPPKPQKPTTTEETKKPIESVFDVVESFRLSGGAIADKMILADGVF